ncbi:hypothetical protein [Candidatus Litorirhabdus singularis]|nr:hypothetical protein [Candidatus Litorirhabdus singularis]
MSLGTGDDEVERRVATRLRNAGVKNLSIYGLELSALSLVSH